MKDIWEHLKQTAKPIVLYGTGNGADKIISVCEDRKIKISGVFASDEFVRKKTFHGMPVTNYKTAKERFGDMIVLLCFGTALPDVISNIKDISRECELYAPDVPVYGDTLFCGEYYESRKDDFNYIYNLLADDMSKKVFNSIIDYKLSGDIDYLFSCQTDEDEAYMSFLKLGDNETYLDLGAYRGDTVLSFIKRVKQYGEIIALEPDIKTYKKLLLATESINNLRCINAAAADVCGKSVFGVSGSRGVGNKPKKTEIEIVSVDSLKVSPTFIKMDIEGDEAKAIAGAVDTIRNERPKMQIAAYHRSGDLADIPKQVLDIKNDYKIYLRHNPCLPAWDVNYYFV